MTRMAAGRACWFAGLDRRTDSGRPLVVGVPPGSRGPEVFAGWTGVLHDADFVGVQLPGRGERLFEEPVDDMVKLADLLAEALSAVVPRTWVLGGHCSGSYLALEVADRMLATRRGPVCLVISSSRSPAGLADPQAAQSRVAAEILAASDQDLAQRLRHRGQIAADLAEPELVTAIVDAYRAAVRAAAEYRCTRPPIVVEAEVWRGTADTTLDRSHAEDWHRYLDAAPRQIAFPGTREHFERPLRAAVERVEEMVGSAR